MDLKKFILTKQPEAPQKLINYLFWLNPSDRDYFFMLYRKYWQKKRGLRINKNFIPSAWLSKKEKEKLGAVEYSKIANKPKLAALASQITLICNPMDGGIGSSLIRDKYLAKIWPKTGRKGPPGLGAKGLDLFFDFFESKKTKGNKKKSSRKISITELKYLQLIKESKFYRKIIIQELVNKESRESIEKFLKQKINPVIGKKHPRFKKLSYRKLILQNKNLAFADEMVVQPALPAIDKEKKCLSLSRLAPGGHGQLGYMVLCNSLDVELPENGYLMRAIYNGDGLNNFPSRFMAGYAAKEKIPLIMVTSTKTSIDRKGGQIGLEIKGQKKRPQILELAQAEAQNQVELFTKIGLEGQKQYFNTNMVLINYTLLSPVLKEVAAAVGKEKFLEIISPDLIENQKSQKGKAYIQLEGALASALLNLAGFIKTSKNLKVKKILKKHKIKDFLVFINLNQYFRLDFFTPVKFAWDFWLYAFSDHFRLNRKSFKLENLNPGKFPGFELSDFYRSLNNCILAFGRASTFNLESLTIKGSVFLKDAKLAGKVVIENELEQGVDLNAPFYRKNFDVKKNRLFIKDVKIRISPKRQVEIAKLKQ